MTAGNKLHNAAPKAAPPPRRRRILFRMVLLSWMVVVFTVCIVVIAIVPYQRDQVLGEMRERANVAATSVAQIATQALIIEDFGAIVDACLNMVKEYPSLEYVVVTRTDGFSLIHTRKGWSQEWYTGLWTPAQKTQKDPEDYLFKNPLGAQKVYHAYFPFKYSGIGWGWIHIGLSPEKYFADLKVVYTRMAWVALLAVMLGFALSYASARRLIHPIRELERFTRKVARGGLTSRVTIRTGDEVESLAHSFNRMLSALERSNTELVEAQNELVAAAHQAGISEVMSGILHNVGNVINSTGITSESMLKNARNLHIGSLEKINALLKAKNKAELVDYFSRDPRSQLLIDYLGAVTAQLLSQKEELIHEAEKLCQHHQHIKQIINFQQEFNRPSGITEPSLPRLLVEDSLRLYQHALGRDNIRIVRDDGDVPECLLDRHKVLQILTNLINNARLSLIETERKDKTIVIQTGLSHNDTIFFKVGDNGIGIVEEAKKKIFTYGYTTRSDGHGLGLHSGALGAKEMSGVLTFHSQGKGQGAEFTLTLPFRKK